MAVTFDVWGVTYLQLINWLEENVGPILNSSPIMYWRGQGWIVQAVEYTLDAPTNYRHYMMFRVTIDNLQLATLAQLRWA
jgi:hypothetical protein